MNLINWKCSFVMEMYGNKRNGESLSIFNSKHSYEYVMFFKWRRYKINQIILCRALQNVVLKIYSMYLYEGKIWKMEINSQNSKHTTLVAFEWYIIINNC